MNELYIVMYHYVRDMIHSRYPNIKGLDIISFKKQIEYFCSHFSIITMEDVMEAIDKKYQLPSKAVLLTFDDGYIDNYTCVLPVLREHNIQGSFFIPGKTFTEHKLLDVNKIHYILACAETNRIVADLMEEMNYYRSNEFDYSSNDELYDKYAVADRFDTAQTVFIKRILQTVLPERLRGIISSKLLRKYTAVEEETLAYETYMSYDQIKHLKREGMFIGVHGYDHYWLANLSHEQMSRDIECAMDAIQECINMTKWVINYPYGNYNQDVIDVAKKNGACLGLTTEVRKAELNNDNPLTLPRFDCNDFPPISEQFLCF